ncbi:transcriptional regulator, Sir2 family protein [Histomonas meleagridis]|uniref:transcriptional regulator, Sir2 family protein n=1 Tax=Histomonas meleagridis TaxID=135588 RepID=UPI003559A835|nr:transcriptional regulator, Sir2 family protein [Histomonas meleagridis]KAH0803949.1 transcriptional regulator, Sir2 family protein [Histomonas meleagridis]
METISLRNTVFEAYEHGDDPKDLLCDLLGKDHSEAASFLGVSEENLWHLIFQIASQRDLESRGRVKQQISDIGTVYNLIYQAKNIVILMGAGASTGPDFRSPGGLYDTVAKMGVLNDPYDVFDIQYFLQNPSIFWSVAHLIFPSETPQYSSAHYFIEALEQQGKLLRVYTQNVDTLEKGIPPERLRCVHGSWRENHCIFCGKSYSIEDLRPAINARTVPRCVSCGGYIKPGIVFFGQDTNFDEKEAFQDSIQADLLIVIGTSLKVRPIANLPSMFYDVPSILINRECVECDFNAELIGDCDDVISNIETNLHWKEAREGGESNPIFFHPNKFIFPNRSGLGTSVVNAGRNQFLVTPRRTSSRDFD